MEVSEQEEGFYCDPCEHKESPYPAECYCIGCREYLCSTCYKVHSGRHHRVQDKESVLTVKPVSRMKDVCTEICQKHGKVIQYFCNSHESFGCSACTTTKHRTCKNVDFIPEVAATFDTSKELIELQGKLAKTFKATENYKSKIRRRSDAVVYQAERAKRHVRNLRTKCFELFDKLESKIDESINELKNDDESTMTELANKVDMISQEIQKHKTDIESCLNEKKMCQLFVKAKCIQEPLNKLSEEVAKFGDSCKIQRYQFKPEPIIIEMLTKITEIGFLDMLHEKAKFPKFEKDILVRKDNDKYKCEITAITLLSEELLVVADNKNQTVKLIHIVNNDIKSTYKADGNGSLKQPFDVTKTHASQIAVTYPFRRAIQFLGISEVGNLTMQREIDTKERCFGIDCMGDNLIVSFRQSNAVKILTMMGAVIRKINPVGSLEFTDYVAVNQKKHVYLSNWTGSSPGSVTCVTTDGMKKTDFEDKMLYGPHGAAVGTHGVVYVCGRFSSNVAQLTEDCSLIQELLTKDDGLSNPLCLALTRKNDKLYIGMEDDNIKVFKLY